MIQALGVALAFALAVALIVHGCDRAAAQAGIRGEDGEMKRAGLIPKYPAGRRCSPLTSLYRSWIDVDGTRREERHSGVDGGRLGEAVLAPAAGEVVAAWQADWGWGDEGALLIRHGREDLGLQDGPPAYYSEFNHLRYDEIRSLAVGRRLERGERIATVFRPGGNERYLPEVHWEVSAIDDEAATEWRDNELGRRYWVNRTGRLVDPIRMLSLNAPARSDGKAEIAPFDRNADYRGFRGFTYILPCPKKAARSSPRRSGGPRDP
jgi:murein DD-endopeptidase MepM/ murein hydrolase activator NlpD